MTTPDESHNFLSFENDLRKKIEKNREENNGKKSVFRIRMFLGLLDPHPKL
jgi:hypothetical protein